MQPTPRKWRRPPGAMHLPPPRRPTATRPTAAKPDGAAVPAGRPTARRQIDPSGCDLIKVPLTLVTGPANAAKAGKVLDSFRRHAEQGDAPLLVVPTAADRDSYSRELLQAGALVGGRVLTWEDLIGLLARRFGVTGRLIGPLRRRALVRRAISDGRGSLGGLEQSAGTPGFTAPAETLFRELGRAGIDSARLGEIDSGLDGDRRDGMAVLHSAYERILEAEAVIDRERQALAVMNLLEAGTAEWDARPVLAYGFSELTVVQRRVVTALASGCEVVVSLPADGRTKVGLAEHTVKAFARHFPGGVPNEILPPQREPEGPGLLEAHLFAGSPRGVASAAADAVRVLVGNGTDAMAQLVASEVEARVSDGVAPEEIAVVVPPGIGVEPLASALRDSGREATWQLTSEFGRTVLGAATVGLLRCALTPADATAADALAFVRAWGDVAQLDLAESIDRQLRSKGDRRATAFLGRWEEESGAAMPLLDEVRDCSDPRRIAGAVKSAARDILARLIGDRGETLRVDEVEQAAALSAATVGMNDVALLFDPEGPAAMIDELASMTIELSAGASRPGAVPLTDALSIRARSFDTVIVCGLEDGVFPSSFTPDPFLEDAAAEGLELGDERLSGSEVHASSEREQFVICAARARERLVLVRRGRDDAGEELARSPFLDEAMRLIGRGFDHADRRRRAGDLEGSSLLRDALRREAALTGGAVQPGIPDRLGAEAAAAIAADLQGVASPTRLEKYTECRAKWLAENVLAPSDFAEKSEPMEFGTLVHKGLEAAIGALVEGGLGPLTEQTRPAAEAAVEALYGEEEQAAGRSVSVRLRVANARRTVAEWIELEIGRNDGWDPRYVEMRFAKGARFEPIDLGDDLTVSGTIDRVDVARLADGSERVVIRDYKSGESKRPAKPDDVPSDNGGNRTADRWDDPHRPVFQAPLYLLAASHQLGLGKGGAFYETLRDGQRRGGVTDLIPIGGDDFEGVIADAGLSALVETMVGRAKAVIAEMRQGVVAPDDGCDCPHPWLCGRRV